MKTRKSPRNQLRFCGPSTSLTRPKIADIHVHNLMRSILSCHLIQTRKTSLLYHFMFYQASWIEPLDRAFLSFSLNLCNKNNFSNGRMHTVLKHVPTFAMKGKSRAFLTERIYAYGLQPRNLLSIKFSYIHSIIKSNRPQN